MQTVDQLGFGLAWAFSCDITVDTMCLQLEYLKSGSLQKLLADNIHAIKGGITVSCSKDLNLLSTVAYFIRQVLDDKVDAVEISFLPGFTPKHLPDDFLPFQHVKFLTWSESNLQTGGLAAAIVRNTQLEGLEVHRDGN
jgi:hypothetical protein